ncbi:hypothetical protein [Nonomuraea composti]|nr:hypothetical protein [Nonomuraea sp. FMUSA5-5]
MRAEYERVGGSPVLFLGRLDLLRGSGSIVRRVTCAARDSRSAA